jgi:hypothetical protein
MNKTIRTHIAALNAAWQRYARTADEQLDPATAEALNRDYVNAWEELPALFHSHSDPKRLATSSFVLEQGNCIACWRAKSRCLAGKGRLLLSRL